MEWILNILARQNKWLLMAEAVAATALIGFCDWLTGWELSLFVLYGLPIFLVVWFVDLRSGLIVAAVCGTTWWFANSEDNPYATNWGYPMAAFTRLAYFVFVAFGGAGIRARRDADWGKIAALERVSDLERDLVKVSEYEQRRIGQDLHDDVCQELAAIGCCAAMLKDDLAAKGVPESESAAEIERLIRGVATKARDLARGIFPVQMEESGLLVALEELVVNVDRLQGVKISLIAPDDLRVHDLQVAMNLFRIAQEAVSNAIRHGGAGEIVISLERDDSALRMMISDNGTGFVTPRLASGMGLRTMQYRANSIGGDLEVKPGATGGVRVTCTIPADKLDRGPTRQ